LSEMENHIEFNFFSSEMKDPPPARRNPSTVALKGKLYAVGGHLQKESNNTFEKVMDDIQEYDIEKKEWKQLKVNPLPITEHKSVVYNNSILLIGGYMGVTQGGYSNQLFTFNPEMKTVQSIPHKGTPFLPRSALSCIVWKDELVVFGGWDGRSKIFYDDIFKFSFKDQTWREIPKSPNCPCGRVNHTAVVYKDSMYVFAGGNAGDFINDFWQFDLTTETWKDLSEECGEYRPPPRTRHGAFVHEDKMYIFGGWNSIDFFRDLWQYNFNSKKWTEMKSNIPRISQSGSCFYENRLYIFGGFLDGQVSNSLFECQFYPDVWAPFVHQRFPKVMKEVIRTVLKLALLDPSTGNPRHPECSFWMLPKDVLFYIFGILWNQQRVPLQE